MSITLHTGLPRTGKTYGMTKVILKCLDEGMVVYSNYKINWNGKEFKTFDWRKMRFVIREYPSTNLRYWTKLSDLYDIQSGVIAMDEAHVYLNSRRWADLPEEMERKIAQHGKDGVHIIGTAQSLRRIDTVMRELVDYLYVYSVFPRPPRHPWKRHKPVFFIRRQLLLPTDTHPFTESMLDSFYFFSKKIAAKYDTLQKIRRS